MCSYKTDVAPAAPGGTIFSLSELKKLLEQDNACVSCVTCLRSINITPLHLADLKTSIRNLLDEKVTKYDVELQGVVLAHKNVKLVAESVVLSDSRSFPLEYVADIYVFKPKIGSNLIGVVNKIPSNREYVSVLVHNIFNVVVYAAHKQLKPPIKMGSSINVTVTYIDFTGRLPFIKAEISSEGLYAPEEGDVSDEDTSPPKSLQTPLRKGLTSILKNSPARLLQSSTDVETESSCAENGTVSRVATTSQVGEMAVRKKKKKKKDKERQDEKGSGKTSSKKRKRSHGEDVVSSSPSKKKKRKHSDRSREDESLTQGNGVLPNDNPVNPLDNTAQIMADQSIFNAASSTPVLGPPASSTKKRKKRIKTEDKTEVPESPEVQQAILQVKSELRTDSGISSSDEKKSDKSVKVKRESGSSHQDTRNSSKDADVSSSFKEDGGKKKKKKKKDKNSETTEDITRRLLEEALKNLKTEP